MKILIFRTHPTEICISSYNVQEIGLAKALVKLGHECDILLWTDKESKTEVIKSGSTSLKVIWLHGRNFFWQGLFDWPELKKITESYDLIQLNEYNQIATYVILCRFHQKCVIYHGPYYNANDKKYNFLNKIFDSFFLHKMLCADPVVLTKSRLATETLKKKGFKRVETVGVGLDVERFEKAELDGMNLSQENRLLYIGEISERRNTLFLIDVFFAVQKQRKSVRMILIGRGKPDYEKKCTQRICELNLTDSITWIKQEKQERLPNYYKNADLFLFPSNYDIFGMVLLESCYFNLPVISSLNGGAQMLADQKLNVCILPLDDKLWAKTILSELNCRRNVEMLEKNSCVAWDFIAPTMVARYKFVVNIDDES